LSRLGAAWRPSSCHRYQKGDLGLSMTGRYTGQETMGGQGRLREGGEVAEIGRRGRG
jgi:hypothetical protein